MRNTNSDRRREWDRLEALDGWHVPPECQGQMVEVAYTGDFEAERIVRRERSGVDSPTYAVADASALVVEDGHDEAVFAPWNGVPDVPDDAWVTVEPPVPDGTCAACGEAGVVVDTTAGEVVVSGEVVATAPAGSTLLLVGREYGWEEPGAVYCETCARGDGVLRHYRADETGELADPHRLGETDDGQPVYAAQAGWTPVDRGLQPVPYTCDRDGNWVIQ